MVVNRDCNVSANSNSAIDDLKQQMLAGADPTNFLTGALSCAATVGGPGASSAGKF